MRRNYYGLALAAIAALGSTGVWQSAGFAGDREIAAQIIEKLREGRDSGELKDFTLDMKVDDGVVLFRGNVSAADQKKLVLAAADGIQGINEIVDEVVVNAKQPAAKVVWPTATVKADEGFSFREALAKTAASIRQKDDQLNVRPDNRPDKPGLAAPEVMPGEIATTAAAEPLSEPITAEPIAAEPIAEATTDEELTQAVLTTLGEAQKRGELKGFGVDVSTTGGVVNLIGKTRSATQRELIMQLVGQTPGVGGVRGDIRVIPAPVQPAPIQPVSNLQQVQVQPASAGGAVPMRPAPYRMNAGAPMQAAPASQMMGQPVGAPVMGQPVPMGGYAGGGAPRYDQPYLPNYAWPGYAAYPNYAAVTYPQQYSPSAFPYIGPFYPYPQVPLGWRKVSLEWDDGWWYLDFTDR